jgi:hypothetical protein
MKTTAAERALVCVHMAIVETLPAWQRQCIDNILRNAIDNIVDDECARVLRNLVDEPQPRRRCPHAANR